MKFKTIHNFLFLGILISISSCIGSRKTTMAKPAYDDAALAFEALKKNRLDFDFFSSSATLNLDSEQFQGSVNAKIRMKKDSLAWISVSKLGFEIARVIITPDSIIGLERIQKTYFKLAKSEMAESTGFDVDFSLLEDFILGNPYLDDSENKLLLTQSDTLRIKPKYEDADIEHFILLQDAQLARTQISMEPEIKVKMSFDEYGELPERTQKFSYFRTIEVDSEGDSPLNLSMSFNNPEIDVEKSFKFSIPNSYTPRDF